MSKKRKAWDAAIQQVAAQTGSKIEVPGKRDGEKRETRRRVNARRWIATSDVDDLRRKMEARLEALEEADHLGENVEEDEEEWVDEDEAEGRGRKAKSKAARNLKKSAGGRNSSGGAGGGKGSGSGGTSSMADLTRRYRVRPLAQILLDDHAAQGGGKFPGPSYVTAAGAAPKGVTRTICAVTGLIGRYKDPNSGLSFASASACAHLKETPPPWLQLSGNAPYFEALRFIKSAASSSVEEGDDAKTSGTGIGTAP